jgi:O-antigen ligase
MESVRAYSTATLRWLWFTTTAVVVVAGPWLFGSWEMWWFWPFACLIALGTLTGGLSCLLAPTDMRPTLTPPARLALWGALPLLLYVALRTAYTPVQTDAERTLLLLLLPLLLATTTAWLTSPRQARTLLILMLVNTAAIAAYGRINHALNGSTRILWGSGYPQYYTDGRASAPFYCPDHYAGLLELGLCMALALVMTRQTRALGRIATSAACLLMLAGILASKSRGALLTLLPISVATIAWGFRQWPTTVRWHWRMLTSCSLLLGAAVALPLAARPAMERMLAYPPLKAAAHGNLSGLHAAAQHTSRYHMYAGAFRSWQDHPLIGIGSGMHPHLWPRYAASPDGNRETGTWPRFTNHRHYSYKVHSDWLQLLQEQGLIGFALTLLAATTLFIALIRQLAHTKTSPTFTYPLTALLALAALAFHSLGDFNLQIPAIGWTLATLTGLGLVTNKGEKVRIKESLPVEETRL